MINVTIDEMEKVEAPVLEGLIVNLESQIQNLNSSILKLITMKKVLLSVRKDRESDALNPKTPHNYDSNILYPQIPKTDALVLADSHPAKRKPPYPLHTTGAHARNHCRG